jgi:hypothetical protein
MKLFYQSFVFAIGLMASSLISAQTTIPFLYHSNTNNWSSNGIAATYRNLGVKNHLFQFQATGTMSNFYKINNQNNNSDNNFNAPSGSKVWSGGLTVGSLGTAFNYGDGNGGAGSFSITNGKYYAFAWEDANTLSNAFALIQETDAPLVSITNVTASPTTPTPSSPMTITVELNNNPSAQEKVYVRYSTNGFTSGYGILLSAATGNGTSSQTFTIPAQAAGTTVTYYAFTSTLNASSLSGASTLTDMATLAFSNNGGANYSLVIPVEMTEFKGWAKSGQVHLNWATAMEVNNSHFVVERSANNQNWTPVGEVAGKGTALTVTDYRWVDANPLPGVNYYRLRQTDLDGTFTLSKVVSVTLSKGTTYAIAPNPVVDQVLRIRVEEPGNEDIRVALYNAQGALLLSNTFEPTTVLEWPLAQELPAGTYFLRINDREQLLLVKQ